MDRLFALSDIHGCFNPFYELVVNVIKLNKSDQLILLGDYIDRGEQSKEVIDFMNSGMTTLLSFGIQNVRELNSKYIKFFTGLDYFKAVGDFLFVHAGFNDLAADPFSDRYTMVWECRPSYHNPVFSGKTIVHGHRPKTISFVQRLINEKSNVIPVDTGCVYDRDLGYGFLSALEINTMNLISVPNSQ